MSIESKFEIWTFRKSPSRDAPDTETDPSPAPLFQWFLRPVRVLQLSAADRGVGDARVVQVRRRHKLRFAGLGWAGLSLNGVNEPIMHDY